MSAPAVGDAAFVGPLLRGDPNVITDWIVRSTASRTLRQLAIIAIGAGTFGAAMGSWRAPEQAVWSAIKLPLVLLGTATGNALINGMLAPLFGFSLTLRESFAAVLTSFSLTAIVLGGFSPLMAFLVWNLPLSQAAESVSAVTRDAMLLTLFTVIAFAGVVANLRLWQLLRRLAGAAPPASRLLFSWLAVNLLFGSQLSWILRPFIGRVDSPVTFLREHALRGSFFEDVARQAADLWGHFFP